MKCCQFIFVFEQLITQTKKLATVYSLKILYFPWKKEKVLDFSKLTTFSKQSKKDWKLRIKSVLTPST